MKTKIIISSIVFLALTSQVQASCLKKFSQYSKQREKAIQNQETAVEKLRQEIDLIQQRNADSSAFEHGVAGGLFLGDLALGASWLLTGGPFPLFEMAGIGLAGLYLESDANQRDQQRVRPSDIQQIQTLNQEMGAKAVQLMTAKILQQDQQLIINLLLDSERNPNSSNLREFERRMKIRLAGDSFESAQPLAILKEADASEIMCVDGFTNLTMINVEKGIEAIVENNIKTNDIKNETAGNPFVYSFAISMKGAIKNESMAIQNRIDEMELAQKLQQEVKGLKAIQSLPEATKDQRKNKYFSLIENSERLEQINSLLIGQTEKIETLQKLQIGLSQEIKKLNKLLIPIKGT